MAKIEIPKLKGKVPKPVLWIGLAIATYLVYRWYKNRQSGAPGFGSASGSGGVTLGTNLNSVLPGLSAGATGPSSGIGGSFVNETISIAAPTSSTGTATINQTGTKMEPHQTRTGTNWTKR